MVDGYKKIGTLIAWDKPGMAYNQGIFGVAVNECTDHVYVSSFRNPNLLVVNGKTEEYSNTIHLPGFTEHFGSAWSAVVWSSVVNRVYVTTDKAVDDPNNGRLFVIDGETEKLIKTIDLPLGVRGIAVDSETGNLFITRYGASEARYGEKSEVLRYCYIVDGYVLQNSFNEVFVYDKNEQFLKKIEVDPLPWELTIKDGKTYVSCKGNDWTKPGTLCIIDNKSMKITDKIKVGRKPRGVAINNGKAYIACRYDSLVYVVDLKTKKVIKRIMVDNDCISLTAYKNKVYLVTREGKKLLGEPYRGEATTLQVIDCKEDAVIKTLSFGKTGHYSSSNSKTERLYVTAEDGNDIWVIDLKTDEVSSRILLGRTMEPHIVNPNNGYIYAASHISDELSIFDGRKDRFIKAIPVDGWPWALALNTKTNRLYVPGYDKAHVSVVDCRTNEVTERYSLGVDGFFRQGIPQGSHGGPSPGLAIDELRNRFYISDGVHGYLHVIEENTKRIIRVYIGWSPWRGGIIDLSVDEKNNKIYCLNTVFNLMTIVDGNNYKILEKIDVPQDPTKRSTALASFFKEMYIDTEKDILYIGRTIFDTKTKTFKGELPIKLGDKIGHLDSKNRKIYVLKKQNDSINIINADNYELEETIHLERTNWTRFETSIAVDPVSNKIYVNPMPVQYAELDVYQKSE